MYVERPASPALSPFVTCRWLHRSERASAERVVPDACMDILWDGEELSIAGPDTAPVHVSMPANRQIVAVRFAPGTGSAILGVPASALCDAHVPLVEVWGDAARQLEETMHEADSVHVMWTALEDAVAERHVPARALDPLMLALVQTLQPTAASTLPSVSQLARSAGVSERQLLRRARSAFGYGPKLLGRILRFQAFRAALREQPQASLAQLALELGYADQAHLTHDVTELAGVPPSQLKREARTAGLPASDFDKTDPTGRTQTLPHENHPNRTTHPR